MINPITFFKRASKNIKVFLLMPDKAAEKITKMAPRRYGLATVLGLVFIALLYVGSELQLQARGVSNAGVGVSVLYGVGVVLAFIVITSLSVTVLYLLLRLLRQRIALLKLLKATVFISISAFILDRILLNILLLTQRSGIIIDYQVISDIGILTVAMWHTVFFIGALKLTWKKYPEALLTLAGIYYYVILLLTTAT